MRLFLVKNFIAATKIFRSFLLSRLLILPSRNFSAGILQTFGDLVRNSFHAEIELCFFGDVGPLPLGVSFREPFCKTVAPTLYRAGAQRLVLRQRSTNAAAG